jgi:hypothetical protein
MKKEYEDLCDWMNLQYEIIEKMKEFLNKYGVGVTFSKFYLPARGLNSE